MIDIEIPYNWSPRQYQEDLWYALEHGCTRAISCWHRRAGKDMTGLQWIIKSMEARVGLYWHIFPTQKQGRKAMWQGRTRDGRRFLDYFPGWSRAGEDGSWVMRTRDDEMSLWVDDGQGTEGSQYQIVGAEDPDSLVGTNPVGLLISEFPVMEKGPQLWNFLQPVLMENGGFALFVYTPRGRNHGYTMKLRAQAQPKRWFYQELTIDDTKRHDGTPLVTKEMVEEAKADGMPDEIAEQEFYVSYDAPLVGSYVGDLISQARKDGRVMPSIPVQTNIPVDTCWDIGIRDATCIWLFQRVGMEVHWIDFFYSSDTGLSTYVNWLNDTRAKGNFTYGKHYLPHDIEVRELGAPDGRTRLESLRKLGVRGTVVPKQSFRDGINAMRTIIPRSYFSEDKTSVGIEGLNQYRRKLQADGATDPSGTPLFLEEPRHDWNSHPADAMRMGSLGMRAFAKEKRRDRVALVPEQRGQNV